MISKEREAEILRLHHAEKWKVGTIAAQLGVHRCTILRVLTQSGIARDLVMPRPSKLDLYVPFILETLAKFPRLRASRLYSMVRERGFIGSADYFRSRIACLRPRPHAEAFLRLRTLPGEQGQVDWAHFGKIRIGKAERTLFGFVMVLAWSRQIFLRFYLNAAMPSFLRGHVEGFAALHGVPRMILYDNLKSAVLERRGDAIRFHPTLLSLVAHYRFEPRPCSPARGNEKGRVERAIRYIRDNFFAAREWKDLEDLNAQAMAWAEGPAADRKCPGDTSRTVRDAFFEEQSKLLSPGDNPFPIEERVEVNVGKTPYVRFDLNDYSIPSTHVRRTLVVNATVETVRILDGYEVLATHARSWDRSTVIENPDHVAELVDRKRQAREHRGIDRLHHAVPTSRLLLQDAAERGGNIGGLTVALTRLLDTDGPAILEAAITEVIELGTPHIGAIRHVLDRMRKARGEPPPLAVELPDDPRIRNIVVRPHSLASYDQLRSPSFDEEK